MNTKEYTETEVQSLIDGLPPYWTKYWHDEYTNDIVVNPKNFIYIGGEECEDYHDWIKYFMNWVDGSLYSIEYCCETYNGPWDIGCDLPPGFDDGSEDIPWTVG